jgi:hypothetical protein
MFLRLLIVANFSYVVFVFDHCALSKYFHFFVCCLKILEQRAFHQKSHGYTWQRWPQDKYINAFGVVLALAGIAQLVPGYYRLATGKGKRE